MVHEDHEHRDDAQQFDAGVPSSSFLNLGVCRCVAFDVRPVRARALAVFAHSASFSQSVSPENSTGVERLHKGALVCQRLIIDMA